MISKKRKAIVVAILLIIAVIISFSLKTNCWNKEVIGVDSAVFITIGEKMHEGKVPYKDVFDHKGPLLYFINYIGTVHESYILLYIIESIFLIADVILLYKIAIRITKSRLLGLLATVFSTITFPLVLQGGNFAEEYTLPFILLALYIFLKPTKEKTDYLLTGISLGAVALLKINMIPVWCIGYLFVIINTVYTKQYKELLKAIAYSLLGFIIMIMPSIIYLLVNDAFIDFINQYIIFNIKYSTTNSTSLIKFICDNFSMYFMAIFLIIVNIYQIIKLKNAKEDRCNLVFSLLFLLLTTIVLILPKNPYLHYTMGLVPCYIIPIAYLIRGLLKFENKYIILSLSFLIVFIFICSIIQPYADGYYLEAVYNISDRVKMIAKEDDDVLVLGNLLIINLLSDTTTECKYIYQYPICDSDERIQYEVGEYIQNELPDVIVCVTSYDYINDTINSLIDEGVYYIDEISGNVIVKNVGY